MGDTAFLELGKNTRLESDRNSREVGGNNSTGCHEYKSEVWNATKL